MKITLEDIFNIPNAVIYYPDLYKSVDSVSIDSRNIKKNSIYVAIKGRIFDGHDFVRDAVKNGAKAVIVNRRKLNRFDDLKIPIISVNNTLDAYAELARIWRNKLSAKVVSITGSNGKTTTKELIAHLLSSKYKVHKTFSNNNNQIGVPLTILSAKDDVDVIVLEHGTNHFGEIEYTAKIAEPDIALITNIGNSHTKFLISKEKILEEKSKLYDHIKQDGKVILNNDDSLLRSIKKNYKNVTTYGFKRKSDINGLKKSVKEESQNVALTFQSKSFNVSLPLLGDANLSNYLAAVSIGQELKLTKSDIIEKTKSIEPVHSRLELKRFKDFVVIDDTYNANPESVVNALKVLKEDFNNKQKVAILGDMFELGKSSEEKHKLIANEIDKIRAELILTIGKNTEITNKSIKRTKNKIHFKNRENLKKYLKEIEIENTVFLVKGSRGMKMEEFVQVLTNRGN